MTLRDFAKEVGVGTHYIKKQMLAGEIPYNIIEIGKNHNYDLDPNYVQLVKDELEMKRREGTRKVRRSSRKGKQITSLQKATYELEKYNRRNGTNLSYGQAVAKGIIEGT